jgi:diguanylate cyclase (GGDEF)-like protein/PAS domain S-box-containing protein
MAEPAAPPAPDPPDWSAEVVRLNKIIRALTDRAERSTSVQISDFSLFQTAIMLEELVRSRTAELEAVLRKNEKIDRALRESEEKFRGLVSQSLVGIVIIEDGKFGYSNAKFDEIFGYGADEIRRLGPLDVTIESDRTLVAENLRKRLDREVDRVDYVFRGLRKNGDVVDIECHSSGMNIGGKLCLISLIMDITERAHAEREVQALQERLREQSTHDALTGLYNRRYLEEALGRELILAEREGHPVSVIMGDLDHFKAVNDRHGHLAGDEVLRVFGDLMKRHARGSDIYCRYGGEEFLLVLPRMAEKTAVERAEHLRSAMAATPVSCGASPIAVTASFGVATFPRDGRSGDEVIAAADSALYSAKAAGRNRVNVSSGPVKQIMETIESE